MTLGEWHHVAMTYDGQILRVYHSGTECGSLQVGRPRRPGKKPFAIGERQDRFVSFGGMIRNVRLYSRSLSESELKANATVEKAPIRDGLVREWPMPEATAADWAANVIAEAGL